VWKQTLTADADAAGKAELPIALETLPKGYYELHLAPTAAGEGSAEGATKASFAVTPFVERSAEEVREGNYRFGLKKWNWSSRLNGMDWDEYEAVAASTRLGLQWTRELLQQTNSLGTVEMIHKYPMNVVMKIERFPREFYDAERYGPMDKW